MRNFWPRTHVLPGSFPLLADVLQGVEGVGVGHQSHPRTVCLALKNLAKNYLLQLKHRDRLLHHHLQQHPIWKQDLEEEEEEVNEPLKRPTSKLNLSEELRFESEEDEDSADRVLDRTGGTSDPCSRL